LASSTQAFEVFLFSKVTSAGLNFHKTIKEIYKEAHYNLQYARGQRSDHGKQQGGTTVTSGK
jgi:hypothetical protein